MYKIGIDARLYSQTGVGVYLRNLLFFLEKIAESKILFFIYLLPEDYDNVKFKNKCFLKKLVDSRWHSFSEQINFAKTLYKDNLDLVHFTYFSYPVLYKKKFIVTVHDTTPLLFKTGKASTKNPLFYEIKFQAFKFVISQQVSNSQFIITPTKTVKRQLMDIYGKKYDSKIKPIYEGVDYELIKVAKRHPELGSGSEFRFRNKFGMTLENNFFIYIGNFYPHKNVENLLKAFAKVRTDAKLVLIGPDDYFAKRLYRYIDITIRDRVIFYHHPTKEELVFFYKNALALVHPSLSEGFGLPIVEAAYFNLPISASNIEVFREILGKNFISFDPLSVDDITNKINLVLNQGKKVEYGNLLEKFSFERMTKETLNLYQEILA